MRFCARCGARLEYDWCKPCGTWQPRRRHIPWAHLGILLVAALVLALAMGPNLVKARAQARNPSACTSNLKNIATALEMYATRHGGRYPTRLAQLTPSILKVIPNCPFKSRDTYSQSYQVSENPDAFTLGCQSDGHYGYPAGYPQYSSYQGVIDR